MGLPLLISVPHAGTRVPDNVAANCQLTEQEVIEDGDVGASAIYHGLEGHVAAFLTTDIARAVIDLNRGPHDRRKDGVVKTHTCWDVPIWREPLDHREIEELIDRHYRPYHHRLTELGRRPGLRLAIDCHTMAAEGPPVGPDPGQMRPMVCIGTGAGTAPSAWIVQLAQAFSDHYYPDVTINEPFSGGFITRDHGREMPWVQIELSRAPVLSDGEKHARVLAALQSWCATRL